MFLFLYQTAALREVSGEQVCESIQPGRASAESVHLKEKKRGENIDQIDFRCYFFLSGDFPLPLPVLEQALIRSGTVRFRFGTCLSFTVRLSKAFSSQQCKLTQEA